MYDDKAATLERIKDTISNRLPQNVRDRLVLENDEVSSSVDAGVDEALIITNLDVL